MALDSQLDAQLAGDTGAQIAVMLVQSARDSRNLAHAAEQAAEERMNALGDEQVQDMYEQADATRSAGQMRALGLIISGGATMAGGLSGLDTGGGAGELEAQVFSGAGNIAKGALDSGASEQDFEAGVHAADATQAQNRMKQVERQLADLDETQRDASQLVRTAIDAAAELSRTKTATDQATLFLRG